MAIKYNNTKPQSRSMAPLRRSHSTGILFTLLSAVGFGITPMLAAGILADGMSPIALAFWRCLLVLPVLLILVLCTPHVGFRLRGSQALRIAGLSLCGAVITGILLISSYDHLDTGSATTLNFTYPIFVLLLGGVFFHQRITVWDVGCFVLCSIGVVLLCGFGGRFSWIGFWQALGSGIAFGCYVLYLEQSRILEELPMASFTFYYFLFGALLLFPVVLLSGGQPALPKPEMWGQTVLYALLCGFLCTFSFQLGVDRIGSRLAAVLSTLEPVVTLAVGMLVLGEQVSWINWLGAAVVLSAAMLLTWRNRNE